MNHLKAPQDMKAKWQVLSPDNITIETKEYYDTKEKALIALEWFCKRYVKQGYYSSVEGHISLDELPSKCRIIRYK